MKINIDKEPFLKVLEKMREENLPFGEVAVDRNNFPPFNIDPPEGYETPTNNETGEVLPNCCSFHKAIFKKVEDSLKEFPEQDPRNEMPLKVAKQHSFTEYVIKQEIENSDWYKAITEYIEYNVSSFGAYRLGALWYLESVKYYFTKTIHTIANSKRDALISFIDMCLTPPKSMVTDLNLIYQTYQKWVKIFPFELSLFSGFKQHFENQLPILVGKPERNRYSGLVKDQIHTKESLFESLLKLTDILLTKVDTLVLHEKGELKNPAEINIELITAERRLKRKQGYLNNSMDEGVRYRKMIKDWLKDEQEFIKKLIAGLKVIEEQKQVKFEENTIKVIEGLNQYKLSEFLVKEKYSIEDISALINNHSGRDFLPYTIALLNEVGFLNYFFTEFSKTKKEGLQKISEIFKVSVRRIKGNINILITGSSEDPTNYTSYQHIENIQKELKKIRRD
jgi:hypothetical protein